MPDWPGRIEPGLSPCQLRRPLRVDTASLRAARTAGSTGSKEIAPAFNLVPVDCRGLLDEKAAVPSVLLLGVRSRRLGPEGLYVTKWQGRKSWLCGHVCQTGLVGSSQVEPLPTPSPLTGRHRLPSVGSNSRVDGGERNLAGVQGSPMRLPGAVAGRLGASVGDRTMSCSRVWVIERVVIPVAPGPKRGLESEKSRGFQGLSPNFRPKSTFMSACRTNSESDRS